MNILSNRSRAVVPLAIALALAAMMSVISHNQAAAESSSGDGSRKGTTVAESIRLVLQGGPLARSLTIPLLSATQPSTGITASGGGGSALQQFDLVLDGAQHATTVAEFATQGAVFPVAVIEHLGDRGTVQLRIELSQAVFSSFTASAGRSANPAAVLTYDSMK